ncbi:hypothetical protein SAY86_010673 [Trapa natans]|uniref:beta-aspartyl-peptidase n=1 Tax=Trapa natans TaxID=22666 RepID=A0AAN7LJZ3_TRANT|nr:hypothetical protein SAY86_010673 [Trapa natans]
MGRGWAIALHGGAGIDPNITLHRQQEAKEHLSRYLNLGVSAIRSSLPAIDVVELVVRELESDPLFNSGKGSALTEKGTVEMDASIMDGTGRRCGAVSGLMRVKNPVSLARLVMEKSRHLYLAFSGGGVELVDNEYFITDENRKMLKLTQDANTIMVVHFHLIFPNIHFLLFFINLNFVHATMIVLLKIGWQFDNSIPITGHAYLPETMSGRIGDTPLIGSGTYACNLCGVSCTGEGEAIIRATLARDVAAVMEYKGLGLQEAVDFVLKEKLDDGAEAGIIAVSREGEVACGFNSIGMFRGFATEDGFMEVAIWDSMKQLGKKEKLVVESREGKRRNGTATATGVRGGGYFLDI